ncbi:hypothetical protein [Rhizobium sp. TH135]|uniref:hypothetical protein n=1 Tax=Rhizobium sp. TH135 TaxID=2067451 RepID=UPI00117D6D7C|nr:hypothetical protein [Rhizobium sp. TH135]
MTRFVALDDIQRCFAHRQTNVFRQHNEFGIEADNHLNAALDQAALGRRHTAQQAGNVRKSLLKRGHQRGRAKA